MKKSEVKNQQELFIQENEIIQVKLEKTGDFIEGYFKGYDMFETVDEKTGELKEIFIIHFDAVSGEPITYTTVANVQMTDFIVSHDFQVGFFLRFDFVRMDRNKANHNIKIVRATYDEKGCNKKTGLKSLDDIKNDFMKMKETRIQLKISQAKKKPQQILEKVEI